MIQPGLLNPCLANKTTANPISNVFQLKSFVWPVLIIMLGLFIIFKPRRQYRRYRWQECQPPRDKGHIFDTAEEKSSEDFIDSTSVMGGVKKNILSKKFKGRRHH